MGEEGTSVVRLAPFTVKRAGDCRAGGHVSVRTTNEKFGGRSKQPVWAAAHMHHPVTASGVQVAAGSRCRF